MTYTPDTWIIMNITGTSVGKDLYYRVLAGWYGGYAGSDSWKISSGITKIVDCNTYWEIHNHSGSIYNCWKHTEKLSGYTSSIFNKYASGNSDELAVYRIPLKEVKL